VSSRKLPDGIHYAFIEQAPLFFSAISSEYFPMADAGDFKS
jgi:hypothetical protein